MPGRPDVRRLYVAVVDAEIKNEHHFGDEQQAEEESEPAQRFLAAFLERHVVDLIDAGAKHIEGRYRQDADQDRIKPKADIDYVGNVGAENDESRMRNVDDVQDAERQ